MAASVQQAPTLEPPRTQDSVNFGPIICTGHSRPIPDVCYSQIVDDEYFLISAALDKNPMLRKGSTGDWIGTFAGHKGAVWSSRLNHDNRLAATASADFTVKLWNAVNGSEIREYAHRHIVKSAVFSWDSKYLYTGGSDKQVRIYDLETESTQPMNNFEGHSMAISNVSPVHSQPFLICSSGENPGIRIWDLRTGSVAKILETPAGVGSLAVSPMHNIMTAATGNQIQFWNMSNLTMMKSFTVEREVKCAALHPKFTCFVVGSMSELWVRVYDYLTGNEIAVQKGHHGPVRCIDFSPLGDAYASGSEDGTIRIWEYADVD